MADGPEKAEQRRPTPQTGKAAEAFLPIRPVGVAF
jgi:hypothetical protein